MRLVLWRMQCGLVPSAAAGLMLGLEVLVHLGLAWDVSARRWIAECGIWNLGLVR
jgi:hypothetical protein